MDGFPNENKDPADGNENGPSPLTGANEQVLNENEDSLTRTRRGHDVNGRQRERELTGTRANGGSANGTLTRSSLTGLPLTC